MTEQQALEILSQATSALQTNRQMHMQIIEALKVLSVFVTEANKAKDEKD